MSVILKTTSSDDSSELVVLIALISSDDTYKISSKEIFALKDPLEVWYTNPSYGLIAHMNLLI
jgi:hypothetical protein